VQASRAIIDADVRRCVAEGLTNRESGQRLGITPDAVPYWRRVFGLTGTDAFLAKFRRTYGADAPERFRALVAEGAT
jgi:hypothetical protein